MTDTQTTTKEAAGELPTQETADASQAYLVEQFFVPALFEKLAEHNIQPRDEAEARQLIELGAVLQRAADAGQYKRAADTGTGNPFLSNALKQAQELVPIDLEEAAVEFVRNDPLAKQAALVCEYVAAGGDLAQPAA